MLVGTAPFSKGVGNSSSANQLRGLQGTGAKTSLQGDQSLMGQSAHKLVPRRQIAGGLANGSTNGDRPSHLGTSGSQMSTGGRSVPMYAGGPANNGIKVGEGLVQSAANAARAPYGSFAPQHGVTSDRDLSSPMFSLDRKAANANYF